MDVIVVLLAGLLLGAAGWGVRRAQLARLPLEIGGLLLQEELLGHRVLRLRVRLGLGRPVRGYRVRAVWTPLEGGQVPLVVDDPGGARIGAWTVTLRADEVHGGGLHVEVEADGEGRTWRAERSWAVDGAQLGRFQPPVLAGRGGVALVGVGWDEAQVGVLPEPR